jgi:hypothetical protein
MLIGIAGLVVAALLIAIGSYVYWRIGQPDGLSPRWRKLPGVEALIVLIVLGAWTGGASILIKSVLVMFSD